MKFIHTLKTGWILWYAILIIGLFSWALVWPGFFRVHDFTHVTRLVEMRAALDTGHFPVQWAPNLGYGYGMPLFLFYGPLPFYMASILTYIGFAPLAAIQALMVLSGVVAWTGMYLTGKRWGTAAGITAATVFLASPYRAVDIYVRGAFNEAWAISWLPWLLYGAMLLSERRWRAGTALTSGAVAAIILTHNLTAAMAFPIFGLLGVIWILAMTPGNHWQSRVKPTLLLALSYVLGIALSLFYSIPAFVEKSATSIDQILGGYFDYHLHFLYIRQLLWENWQYGGSGPGPDDGISFHLGLPVLFAGGLLAATWLLNLVKSVQQRHWPATEWLKKQVVAAAVVAFLGASCYLTLFHAEWIWNSVSIMTFFQFPWRFLALTSTLGALLVAVALGNSNVILRWSMVGVITLMVLLGQWRFHQPESFLERPENFYYTDTRLIRRNMSEILPDYISNTFDEKALEPLALDTPRIEVVSELLTEPLPALELNDPHQLLLLANLPVGSTVTWNIADFPGWEYTIDDQVVTPELLPDGRRQLVLTAPASAVGARFAATPIREQTAAISLIALVIWLSLWVIRTENQTISLKKHSK